MKSKMLLFVASMAFMAGLVSAGTPQDRDVANGSYTDSSVFGSTQNASSTLVYTLAAPATKNSGGTSFSGRYCFNNIIAQLAANSTGYLIDNSTIPTSTNAIMFVGAGITTPIQYNAPHLEPLCFGVGDSASFVTLGTAGTGVFTYQGFTTYGSAGGTVVNKGL